MTLCKRNVERGFSRAAQAYNRSVCFQKQCVRDFAGFLHTLPDVPATILEAGCGTGNLTELLHGLFPDALISATDLASGMIEFCRKRFEAIPQLRFQKHDFDTPFPFREQDLAVSSLSLQWSDSLPNALDNLAASLKTGGHIAVSIPLEHSLNEIHAVFRSAGGAFPGLRLPSEAEVCSAMENLFADLHFVCGNYTETYPSLRECLQSMRRNGTSGGGKGTPVPLMKKILRENPDSPFTVQYNVLFASGKNEK